MFAALGLVAGGCRDAPAKPISIVFVSLDTLRADRISAYGYAE